MTTFPDGYPGRDISLTFRGAAVVGIQEKGMEYNGEPINVTNDDNDGYQKLIDKVGTQAISINVQGVDLGDTLKTIAFSSSRTGTAIWTMPNGSTLTGTFILAKYKDTGKHDDATTFEATFMSSGAWVWSPAM